MKSKTLVVVVVILYTLIACIESFAVRKKLISTEEAISKISGVWVNTEYPTEVDNHAQKLIVMKDGKIEWFMDANMIHPNFRATYSIVESWTDSRGHIYCTIDQKHMTGCKLKELWKIDKSGKMLEINSKQATGEEYPTKIEHETDIMANPIMYYMVYYRQE